MLVTVFLYHDSDDFVRETVEEAMEYIQSKSCLKFEKRNGQDNYINIAYRQ